MPDDKFHITLNGLDSDEIATYALREIYCLQCMAEPEVRCNLQTPDRIVCKQRFTEAIRALRDAGENAIRDELSPAKGIVSPGGNIVLLKDSLRARGVPTGFINESIHDSSLCDCGSCREFRLANSDSTDPWVA